MKNSSPEENNEKQLMKNYLLGDLSSDEQTQIEEKYFADDSFYQQLKITETELIDAYLCNELDIKEKKKFEEKFLSSKDGKQKVEMTRAFLKSINKITGEKAVLEIPVISNYKRRFVWSESKTLKQFALAASLVILLGGGSWLMFQTIKLQNQIKILENQQSQQQADFQKKEQLLQQKSDTSQKRYEQIKQELDTERQERTLLENEISKLLQKSAQVISMVLTTGLTRDNATTKLLNIPPDAQILQLKLMLEEGVESYSTYQVTIKTVDGKQIWQQKVTDNVKKSINVSVKTVTFSNDDYLVTVSGINKNGEVFELADYYFRVAKK